MLEGTPRLGQGVRGGAAATRSRAPPRACASFLRVRGSWRLRAGRGHFGRRVPPPWYGTAGTPAHRLTNCLQCQAQRLPRGHAEGGGVFLAVLEYGLERGETGVAGGSLLADP